MFTPSGAEISISKEESVAKVYRARVVADSPKE
jgi:hypothetical protein